MLDLDKLDFLLKIVGKAYFGIKSINDKNLSATFDFFAKVGFRKLILRWFQNYSVWKYISVGYMHFASLTFFCRSMHRIFFNQIVFCSKFNVESEYEISFLKTLLLLPQT